MTVGTDPLYNLLLEAEFARRGIVPLLRGSCMDDMNRNMEHLDPAAKRIAKRKFRKAWRSAAKKSRAKVSGKPAASRASTDRYISNELGMGTNCPGRKHKTARKLAVLGMVREGATAAMSTLKTP